MRRPPGCTPHRRHGRRRDHHDLVRDLGRLLPAPRLERELVREPGRLLPALRLELERWTGTAR